MSDLIDERKTLGVYALYVLYKQIKPGGIEFGVRLVEEVLETGNCLISAVSIRFRMNHPMRHIIAHRPASRLSAWISHTTVLHVHFMF